MIIAKFFVMMNIVKVIILLRLIIGAQFLALHEFLTVLHPNLISHSLP